MPYFRLVSAKRRLRQQKLNISHIYFNTVQLASNTLKCVGWVVRVSVAEQWNVNVVYRRRNPTFPGAKYIGFFGV